MTESKIPAGFKKVIPALEELDDLNIKTTGVGLDYTEIRFRGFPVEIKRLTDYLSEQSINYDERRRDKRIVEVRVLKRNKCEKITLIVETAVQRFPALKALAMRTTDNEEKIEKLCSKCGFPRFTGCWDDPISTAKAMNGIPYLRHEFDWWQNEPNYDNKLDKYYFEFPEWENPDALLEINGEFYGDLYSDFFIFGKRIERFVGYGDITIPDDVNEFWDQAFLCYPEKKGTITSNVIHLTPNLFS